jgi:glycosyltransferase involved in cell wall biosynthesis
MKIANIMLSNRFGGIGQVYLDYNEALSGQGHELLAVCHRDCVWSEATTRQARDRPRMETAAVAAKGGPLALWTAWTLRRRVRRFAPDVIVIHNYVRLGLWACRGIAPTVAVTHMYKSKHFEKFDAVLALTPELRTRCEGAGVPAGRIHLVPNFIAGPFPPPAPRPETPPPIIIGALGRLDHVKGYRYLIEASALLRDRGVPHRILLGGTGFEEANLRRQVAAAGLESTCEFLGYVADKAHFFGKIDLFCMPSLEEPFGLTVLEGMKFGKPIVATQIGGPASILTHELNALLVPPKNPFALAEALTRLITEPAQARELAEAASRHVRSTYALEVVAKTLETTLALVATSAENGFRPETLPPETR